jgi:hypothetical protein
MTLWLEQRKGERDLAVSEDFFEISKRRNKTTAGYHYGETYECYNYTTGSHRNSALYISDNSDWQQNQRNDDFCKSPANDK